VETFVIPRVHQNCPTCTCAELNDTAIRQVVAATPEQLAEHREIAALDAMDREHIASEALS
jgi:hypothetical protein